MVTKRHLPGMQNTLDKALTGRTHPTPEDIAKLRDKPLPWQHNQCAAEIARRVKVGAYTLHDAYAAVIEYNAARYDKFPSQPKIGLEAMKQEDGKALFSEAELANIRSDTEHRLTPQFCFEITPQGGEKGLR